MTLALLCTAAELEAATPAERAAWGDRLLARMARNDPMALDREYAADHADAVAADEWTTRET